MMIIIVAMIILIKILVILMIMMTKITEKPTNIVNFGVKYYLFRDYYLVVKKDQKIRARVNPPPHFRAMPELKPSFAIDVFPYSYCFLYTNIFIYVSRSMKVKV